MARTDDHGPELADTMSPSRSPAERAVSSRRSVCRLTWSSHASFWAPSSALSPHRRAGAEPRKKVDFNFQVRPILSDKCFNCHGPDSRQRKAGLRLDTKEGAFGTNKSGGHAIVPGNLDESDLVARITAEDESERMPPKSLGRSLSTEEIEILKRWIEQGAEWKPHWSFLPPVAAPSPTSRTRAGPRNPLDSFVLARLDAEGLSRAAEASKERLIRRVTFDLTGLPPTLAEIDAFLADTAPDAYERAGRPPAGFAPVRRANGRRLARPGSLRRYLRLPGRRLSRHVALARLGRQGVQCQSAL